ncbi:MAG: F0F1 ATP synthase subunit A [Alphaproteobacteria bacterium]|nr:F0F1 ATP synthase subunit A [Alphaproteobacteria bacterium]
MASPLEQFEISPIVPIQIGGIDLSFTNSSLWMTIAVIVAGGTLTVAAGRGAMVPGRLQTIGELLYEFIAGLIKETIGSEGRKYFPIIFTVFVFVLTGNLLGMIPYSFTFTSHIIVTFAMAIVIFLAVTVLGFVRHGTHFFSFFVPPGTPLVMYPLMIPIEILSYLSRPISLAVRLFANMMAGHILLKVIAGFVAAMGVFGILPLALVVALTGLEIIIAFLQAYVFTILTCLYINDAIKLH